MNTQNIIDARGLSCPQPVLETKRFVDEHSTINEFRVLVDNYVSSENVGRFARNHGFDVSVLENSSSSFELIIKKNGHEPGVEIQNSTRSAGETACAEKGHVIYLSSNVLGSGDDDLGRKLVRGFLRTLIDMKPKPWRIILINSGVKLAGEDDESIEALNLLEEKGVEILACGTCLDHFGLKDQLKAGRVTSMYEVIESFYCSAKVISPQ